MRTNKPVHYPTLTTHEGAPAPRISNEQALRRSVMSCLLWENSFYESGEAIADRITSLAEKLPFETVAAIAVEAKEQMKLRHVPLFLASLLAKRKAPGSALGDLIARVITRADEPAEFLSLYWQGGPAAPGAKQRGLTKQVKRGLALAFQKFDEYQLAKYDRAGAVRLRDALFLCHAKPKDEAQAALWKRLVDDELATPDTWEVALSGGGGKRETFERLMAEGKLGALAFLRNLRNMHEAGVPLATAERYAGTVKAERLLPFQFITAAMRVPQWEPMIEGMMLRCLAGMDRLPGRTALVIDTSPSMWMAKVSRKSEMTRFDAAAALAILIREVCAEANVYYFNERAGVVPPRRGFALRDALKATQAGYSRGGLAVRMANHDGYDRIIVLTDGEWHAIDGDTASPALIASPPPLTERAYMLNVSVEKNGVGYGKWTSIDGWSEHVLRYIQEAERAVTPSQPPP